MLVHFHKDPVISKQIRGRKEGQVTMQPPSPTIVSPLSTTSHTRIRPFSTQTVQEKGLSGSLSSRSSHFRVISKSKRRTSHYAATYPKLTRVSPCLPLPRPKNALSLLRFCKKKVFLVHFHRDLVISKPNPIEKKRTDTSPGCSRVVPHHSTEPAHTLLTSEF